MIASNCERMSLTKMCIVLGIIGIVCVFGVKADGDYMIGVGRADCTGPPVEVVFVSINL